MPRFVFDAGPTGGWVTSHRIDAVNLLNFYSGAAVFLIVIQVSRAQSYVQRVEVIFSVFAFIKLSRVHFNCMQIVYACFVVAFIVKEVRAARRVGWRRHLRRFWSWIEIAIIVLSVTGIVLYFYRSEPPRARGRCEANASI